MTLPELHLADWRATKDTLHLYSQILGKIRLATTPPRNHWWNVPLYVDVRGLTTRRLHHSDTTFEITLDFVDHALVVRTGDGRTKSFELGAGLPVADFDAATPRVLAELGIDIAIRERAVRRPDDHAVSPGPRARVLGSRGHRRFGRILDWTTRCSRSSADGSTARPAQCTCSGTASTSPSPGSPAARRSRSTPIRSPKRPTRTRSSRSGSGPATTPSATPPTTPTPPPSPTGCATSRWPSAAWIESGAGSLAIVPYETVRTARDPRTTLLAFCQSAYEAGARLAGWDTTSFTSTWCPTPDQLQQLHANAAADFGRTKDGMR